MNCCIACGKKFPEEALFVLKDAPASAQDIPDAVEVLEDKGISDSALTIWIYPKRFRLR